MPKFRKKPIVVEAVQFEGGLSSGCKVWTWARNNGSDRHIHVSPDYLKIETLEGIMRAEPGDWIIRGISGEVYPCKPEIFKATYEPVEVM